MENISLMLTKSVHSDIVLGSITIVILRLLWVFIITPKSLMGSILSGVKRTYNAYRYLLQGLSITEEAYSKANGKPFMIETPERPHYMITSPIHISQLDKASRRVLSLNAVAKDFLQPKHTMNGFEWRDERGIEATGLFRTIRSLLSPNNLPSMIPVLQNAITSQTLTEIRSAPKKDGFASIPILDFANKIVLRCNATMFFPKTLVDDPVFMEAALGFTKDAFLSAEILKLLPSSVGPFLARIATKNHRRSRIIRDMLHPVVERRFEEARRRKTEGREPDEQHKDAIQLLVNMSSDSETWSTERLIGEIMAAWYGSLHTLSITTTNALMDLYSHPEYMESLRTEAQGPESRNLVLTADGLPQIDSFLRESLRVNAFEATIIRRQALQDFQLTDGPKVPRGAWLCVPYRAMMRDETQYPHASSFDGRRFLSQDSTESHPEENSLSAHSDKWLLWGVSRLTCPGRFYSSAIMKLVFIELLTMHDCGLDAPKGTQPLMWRGTLIPRGDVMLKIRAGQ